MEQTISHQEMESIKALSDINLKVSEAGNLLFKLQEQETEYLVLREKKVMDRVKKTVEDSKEMVKQADDNYVQIRSLYTELSDFAKHLTKTQEDFNGLLAEFDERNVQWERDIGKQQDDIADIQNRLKVDKQLIENDRKTIEQIKVKQEEQQRKIDSDRGTLQRTIARLKIKNL